MVTMPSVPTWTKTVGSSTVPPGKPSAPYLRVSAASTLPDRPPISARPAATPAACSSARRRGERGRPAAWRCGDARSLDDPPVVVRRLRQGQRAVFNGRRGCLGGQRGGVSAGGGAAAAGLASAGALASAVALAAAFLMAARMRV